MARETIAYWKSRYEYEAGVRHDLEKKLNAIEDAEKEQQMRMSNMVAVREKREAEKSDTLLEIVRWLINPKTAKLTTEEMLNKLKEAGYSNIY